MFASILESPAWPGFFTVLRAQRIGRPPAP